MTTVFCLLASAFFLLPSVLHPQIRIKPQHTVRAKKHQLIIADLSLDEMSLVKPLSAECALLCIDVLRGCSPLEDGPVPQEGKEKDK